MTRSDVPADQSARADSAHNFAAECRLAENAAIVRAETSEQRVAALEQQVRALRAIPLLVDYTAGTSTFKPESDPVAPVPATATGANIAALPSALEKSTVDRTVEQFSQFGATLMNVLSNTVASQVVCSQPKTRPSDVGLSSFTGASSSSATVI
jgi:hypothetical protein